MKFGIKVKNVRKIDFKNFNFFLDQYNQKDNIKRY